MRSRPRISSSAYYVISCTALVLSSCRGDGKRSPNGTSSNKSAVRAVAPLGNGRVDSITAVRLAKRAFPSETLRVFSLKHTRSGVEISLVPLPPGPGYVRVRGGGIVRVAPDGAVRILERHR